MPFDCITSRLIPWVPEQIRSIEWITLAGLATVLLLTAIFGVSRLRRTHSSIHAAGLSLAAIAITCAVYPRDINPPLGICGFNGYVPYTDHDRLMIAVWSAITITLVAIPLSLIHGRRSRPNGVIPIVTVITLLWLSTIGPHIAPWRRPPPRIEPPPADNVSSGSEEQSPIIGSPEEK